MPTPGNRIVKSGGDDGGGVGVASASAPRPPASNTSGTASLGGVNPVLPIASPPSTSDYDELVAENASLRASVVTLREVIDVLLDGMGGAVVAGGGGVGGNAAAAGRGDTHPRTPSAARTLARDDLLEGESRGDVVETDVTTDEDIAATSSALPLSSFVATICPDLPASIGGKGDEDRDEDGSNSYAAINVVDGTNDHDVKPPAVKEELKEVANKRKKRGGTARRRRGSRRGRRRGGIDAGGGGTKTMATRSDNRWQFVARRLMSFSTRFVPALAMASIVVVMIVTSIVRVQGIVGDDGGGRMAIGARVDDGPPPLDESWTMRIRDHDDDDDTIIEDGYSSTRILQGTHYQSTRMPVDAPAPANPGAFAPGDVSFKDATLMPSGVVGYRPESDSLFDASISLGQVCVADPERCGCPDVYQTDYRGSINITRSGQPCMRWDDEKLIEALETHFEANLMEDVYNYSREELESNFCRNYNNDPDGTWCYVGVNPSPDSHRALAIIRNYCNVPVCDMLAPTASPSDSVNPTSSSRPTMTSLPSDVPSSSASPTPGPSSSFVPTLTLSPTQQCKAADKSTCGCEVYQWADYRGTINKTKNGVTCERWDSNEFGLFFIQDYPDGGLDENYCRASGSTVPICIASFEEYGFLDWLECDVPKCDPCSCMPPCDERNEEKCGCPSVLQAESCCEEDDSRCKCGYLTNACHTNLQNNSTDFCMEAQIECCKYNDAACKCGYWKEACNVGMKDVYYGEDMNNVSFANFMPCYHAVNECCTDSANPSCECSMYDDICSVYQSESTCNWAGNRCCYFDSQLFAFQDVIQEITRCLCDFCTYNENVYGFKSEKKSDYCARGPLSNSDDSNVKFNLEIFYGETGGDYWFDNTGWLDDTIHHCQWFGLTCNDDNLIVKIELKRNNLTGTSALHNRNISDLGLAFDRWSDLPYVKVLDLSENNLSGRVDGHYLRHLSTLEHIDISNNAFSGYADMYFSPSTIYANFSHNNFIGVSFKRFNPAYESLKVIDLGNNDISQDSSELFLYVPPNLEELDLSNNALVGSLPNPFPCERIRRLAMGNNFLSGDLPDFPNSNPVLRELDLSNQKSFETGGLTGTISLDMFKLSDLTQLDLSGNSLTGPIPPSIGNLVKLEVLNLSGNTLDQRIPSELGKLDVLEVLDLSHNELNGMIPPDIGGLVRASVYLRNNPNIFSPAPLTLCSMSKFDLTYDESLCPKERDALKVFFDSAKGGEWTTSDFWVDEYTSHCEWYGIECNEANNTIRLDLQSNGLSGILTPRIGDLRSLEILNLNNNNIKGKIPTEIGLLSNLTYLRLSYNEFGGNETSFGSLESLKLVHLHGNRLSGIVPTLQLDFQHSSSYVSDCGNPSDFNPSLRCDDCTMCCNSQSNCYPLENTLIQDAGFDTYGQLTMAFIGGIIAASLMLALASIAYDEYMYHQAHFRQQSLTDRDKTYALESLGINSVYKFFMGKSICGWTIVVMTISAQFWLLTVFVESSERDLSDDKVVMVYFWKCTRDSDVCFSTTDLNWKGWLAFIIMMFTHLSKDVINGVKMILLCAKEREDRLANLRLFIGGTTVLTITLFTLYVSTIYNDAIATSNTEILVNSVVIILVTLIDELMSGILLSISPSWVASMSLQQVPQSLIHQSYPRHPPSQPSTSQKPRQTKASALGEHDEDDEKFADDYDDVDSLERERIPLENVEYKSKASEVREVELGAAVYIS